MSWSCYIVEIIECDPLILDPERPNISMTRMYRIPGTKELLSYQKLKIGAIYKTVEGIILVKLPGMSGYNEWAMNRVTHEGYKWTITGEIPTVTATPSINCVGIYHGFVTKGIVTDDCEGRKFDDYGKQI